MRYIIYDLEATCWEGWVKRDMMEVIEIGAIKFNEYGEALSHFHQMIRPVVNPSLSVFCKKLTGIKQFEVNQAPEFSGAFQRFEDWVFTDEDDVAICSWGDFDRKVLIRNGEMHRIDTTWVDDLHFDVKRDYVRLKQLNKPVGLKRAVENEGFSFTGEHHRGLDDAENLSKVFIKYLGEWAI